MGEILPWLTKPICLTGTLFFQDWWPLQSCPRKQDCWCSFSVATKLFCCSHLLPLGFLQKVNSANKNERQSTKGILKGIICNPFVWSGLKTLPRHYHLQFGVKTNFYLLYWIFFFTLCRVSTYCLFSYHSGFPSNWELAEGLSPFQWLESTL